MSDSPERGWDASRRLIDEYLDEYTDERLEALTAVSILEVAEALDVQIHPPPGLTCPDPGHPQSGHSAPASVFVGDEGYELFKCHACGAGGTAIDYVLLAEHAENYAEALNVLRELTSSPAAGASSHRPVSRYRRSPEDPERCRPVLDPDDRQTCEVWCAQRAWYPGLEVLLRGQWAFVYDERGLWLRLFADADHGWWQDRAIGGQLKPDGEPWRWRSPAGHSQRLTVWEPIYTETLRQKATDPKMRHSPYVTRTVIDHTPSVAPLTLVVEGGSDFITAVAAQVYLPIARRFTVVALPGAGRSDLLTERDDDWAVLVDSDDAGKQCRERIDADHTVRHLYVPEQFNDLSESWASIHHLDHPDREQWINDLRDALEGS